MITRLTCLVFAVVLLAAALTEPAVALAVVATGITVLVFLGQGRPEPARCASARLMPSGPSWPRPGLGVIILSAGAAGCTLIAVGLTLRDTYSLLAIVAWFVAMGCLVGAGAVQDRLTARQALAWLRAPFATRNRPDLGTVLAITAVGFVMRYYDLSLIPPRFHGDEGEMGLLARSIINGQDFPFFSTAPLWVTAYLAHYLQAVSLQIFGPTVFGLRILTVILGTLCIPVAYGLGRIGWGPVAGAIAAWLMAVGHLHVHYSRMGVNFIEGALLISLLMLLFAAVYARGEPSPANAPAETDVPGPPRIWTLIMLAGVAAGLSLYFYQSSRLAPVVALGCLALLWRRGRISLGHAAAFGFAFLVIVAPLGSHFLYRPAQFMGRLWDAGIVRPEYLHQIVGPDVSMPSALPALLWEQLHAGLGLLLRSPDDSGFYTSNIPVFDVVTASLFWLGLGVVIAHARRYHEAALLLWLGLGVFSGSVLSLGSLSGPRLLIVLTPVYLLGGVFVTRLWQLVRTTPLRQLDWLAAPIGTTLALWLLAANLATYFYDFASRAEGGESAAMAREMLVEPDQYRVYFLTSPQFDPNHGSVRYIAYGISATNLREPNLADFTMPPDDGKGVLALALEHRRGDLAALESRFPGGIQQRVNAPNGRLMYISYRVPPQR